MSREDRMAQLWETPLTRGEAWLPGYCVFGEGLYFELDEALVQEWEAAAPSLRQAAKLQGLYGEVQAQRQLRERDLTPRYLLVHTLAHVLMNQLTFECGYSSAALRERLYVSQEAGEELAAVLIYTAAGDARERWAAWCGWGSPGYLERVLADAVMQARWCAADPVCMEIGSTTGQGPDSSTSPLAIRAAWCRKQHARSSTASSIAASSSARSTSPILPSSMTALRSSGAGATERDLPGQAT